MCYRCLSIVCRSQRLVFVSFVSAVLFAPAPVLAQEVLCRVVFRVASTGLLGSIGWGVDYSGADGEFVGTGNDPLCSGLVPGGLTAYFDDDAGRRLNGGFVAEPAVTTPRNLAECSFRAPYAPRAGDFDVSVTSASDGGGANIVPLPTVSVSSLQCEPAEPGSTTTSTTTTTLGPVQCQEWDLRFRLVSATRAVGAIQFSASYLLAPGEVKGSGSSVECTNLVAGTLFAKEDTESQRKLTLGIISNSSFSAPRDLVTCRLVGNSVVDPPVPGDFPITIEDATDSNIDPISVGVSVQVLPTGGATTCSGVCGDGVVNGSEQCDDGNGVNSDSCLTNCLTAKCGDGIVRTGVEQCDDGNGVNTDACLTNCVTAKCGDGIVRTGVEQCDDGNGVNSDSCLTNCLTAKCGDGIVRTGVEQCDDGNGVNTDTCLTSCVAARCGDGIVRTGVEQCDDTNFSNTDACTNSCTTARCGDSFVRTGVEQCDDGNLSNTDACIGACVPARCGDGYVRAGLEECDDGNVADGDECSSECESGPVCGDPTGDGRTLVGDALRTLQSVVGVEVLCPDWTCDVNGDGAVSAVDALSMLRMAVDLPVARACPEPSLLKIRLLDPRVVSGLQFEVDYSSVPARLAGNGDLVQCKGLVAGTSFVFNDKPSDVLAVAMLKLEGVSGPRWLAECQLLADGHVRSEDFRIRILDAQSPSGATMSGVQVQAIPY